jgi:hypothetical protein
VTTYERVIDGEVVERVTPIDGSHEDTRLGVLVLDGGSEWRVEGAQPASPALNDETSAVPEHVAPQDTPSADSAPDTNVSEETDGAATTDGNGTGTDGNKPGSRRQRG